jgi:hypothetical protein
MLLTITTTRRPATDLGFLLMKAGSLVRGQYAAVGSAAVAGLSALSEALDAARARGVAIDALAASISASLDDATRYRAAYNRYVAPFAGIEDLRIAPFTCSRAKVRSTATRITCGTWRRRIAWPRWIPRCCWRRSIAGSTSKLRLRRPMPRHGERR